MHNDGTETFKYVIMHDHFSVSLYSNEKLTLVMNPIDSLYYETPLNLAKKKSDKKN